MLKKYRGDLENLSNLVKNGGKCKHSQGASRKDSSYIPYIIDALEAIAKGEAMKLKTADHGMGNIIYLPSDPSERLNLLVNKNYEENFARILSYEKDPGNHMHANINFSKENLEKFAQELASYFAGPQITKPVEQPMLQPTVALEQPQPAPAAQHTVPKTPSMVKQISQSQARDMLQKYRGDLENLSNLVKNGASNHPPEGAKKMDSSYIPYIIEALEAIAENKAFTPRFAISGMGNIFGLPSDPSECLNLLVNGNHKGDFARILSYEKDPGNHMHANINFSKDNLEKFAQELASYFAGPQITKPVEQPMLQPTVEPPQKKIDSKKAALLQRIAKELSELEVPADKNKISPQKEKLDALQKMLQNEWPQDDTEQSDILFLVNKQLERYEELKNIKLYPKVKKTTKATLNASLRDKAVAEESDFAHKGAKQDGVSAGYVATEKETNETFILKQFFKEISDCVTGGGDVIRNFENRNDGVRELIGATMYQFLLYDRAPKEQLVTGKDEKSLYVRSKFFENVEQLSVFSGSKENNRLNPGNVELKNIEGFEKVIAACHILGEVDYHPGNMMVTTDHKVTKIDHGKSFIGKHVDFTSMIVAAHDNFKRCGYDNAIANGNLTFDIKKYSSALNQMVTQLSEEQIDAIVDQRLAELQKANFNPQGLNVVQLLNVEGDTDETYIADFDALRSAYKDIIKKNLKNMKDIAKQVEIVAKFSNVTPEFKKGGWLKAFAESNEKDPIKYAIANNIKIDDIDLREYALQHNINIQERDSKPSVAATISPQEQQEEARQEAAARQERQQKYKEFHAKTPKEQRADLKKLIQEYKKKIDQCLSHTDIDKSLPRDTPESRKASEVVLVMQQMKEQMFSDGMIDEATRDTLNIASIKATSAKHQFFKFVYKVLDSVHAAEGWDFKASVYNKMKKAEIIAQVKEITKDIGSKKTGRANSKGGGRNSSVLNL